MILAINEPSPPGNHDIVSDGYNLGRDYIVGNITGTNPPPSYTWPTNTTTYTGQTFAEGWVYDVNVKYVGLTSNSSNGVNHQTTVTVNGRGASDGLVAVLTVNVHTVPRNATRYALLSTPPQGRTHTVDSDSISLTHSLGPSIFASFAVIFLACLSPFLLALP